MDLGSSCPQVTFNSCLCKPRGWEEGRDAGETGSVVPGLISRLWDSVSVVSWKPQQTHFTGICPVSPAWEVLVDTAKGWLIASSAQSLAQTSSESLSAPVLACPCARCHCPAPAGACGWWRCCLNPQPSSGGSLSRVPLLPGSPASCYQFDLQHANTRCFRLFHFCSEPAFATQSPTHLVRQLLPGC